MSTIATPPNDTIAGVPVDTSVSKPPPPSNPPVNQPAQELMIDGRKYTAAEVAALNQKVAESDKLRQAVTRLYDKQAAGKTLDTADIAALRTVYETTGWTKEEIDQHIQQLQGGADAGGDQPQTKPQASVDQSLVHSVIRQQMQDDVATAMREHAELTKLVAGVEKLSGKEEADSLRATLSDELRIAFSDQLRKRRDREGGFKDVGWLKEEMPKALNEIVKRYKPLMAAIQAAGKSTSITGSQFAGLDGREPVKPPIVKGGPIIKGTEFDTKMDEFLLDQFMRIGRQDEERQRATA